MSVALRTLPPLLFGKEHPYGVPFTGTGDPAVVQKLTRNDLASFHHRWIRADNAEIFAVGNTSLSELKPRSEEHTSELQYLLRITYAVFCLKKKHQSHHTY